MKRAAEALPQVAHAAVTVAGHGFELLRVKNAHLSAPTSNHAGCLQLACHKRHGRSLHSHHMRKKSLRQGHHVAVAAIAQLEKPAAYARLCRVTRVASGRLLR